MRVVRAVLCLGFACVILAPAGVAAETEVHLGLDRETVRAGGELRLRIENPTPEGVSYGRAYEIARWNPGKQRWIKIDLHRLFSQDLLWVAAGKMGRWEPVTIGPRWVPGRYRVRKSIGVGPYNPDDTQILSARFEVTAPSPSR